MTSFFYNYSNHAHLHRRGWLYSVILHAMMSACTLVLMSRLTPSFESDSFKWNVALMESPGPQPTLDPLAEVRPAAPSVPPKPKFVKPRSVSPAAVSDQAQQEVVPRQFAQVDQGVTQVTPVNQTASTIITQPLQPHDLTETMAPVLTQDRVAEEEPTPMNNEVASDEAATSVEPTIHSVVHQSLVEAASETPAQVLQHSVEQVVASAAPFKAAPAAKADYGWLMRALLGRIEELKNYPVMARMNRWEGKVILRAVIKDDGQVLMVEVQESSGRSILDNDAMETLKKASPLKLDHPLGKPQVAIVMPISYSLR